MSIESARRHNKERPFSEAFARAMLAEMCRSLRLFRPILGAVVVRRAHTIFHYFSNRNL